MLELFDEEVYEHISGVMQSTHKLHKFDLTDLNNHNWSTYFVARVEAIWAKSFDLLKLLELEVLHNRKINVILIKATY